LFAVALPFAAPTAFAEPGGNKSKPGFFTCSGSALRLTFQGPLAGLGTIEPFASGSGDQACQTANTGLLQIAENGVVVQVFTTQQEAQRRGSESAAQALHVVVPTPAGTFDISLLSSFAQANCQNNPAGRPTARKPVFSSGSEVVSVKRDGVELVPAVTNPINGLAPITIPGVGTISFNESETTTTRGRDRGGETTISAFTFKGELFNLVIAESTADYHGQPCAPGQTKP
jgi:hypothetical protein